MVPELIVVFTVLPNPEEWALARLPQSAVGHSQRRMLSLAYSWLLAALWRMQLEPLAQAAFAPRRSAFAASRPT